MVRSIRDGDIKLEEEELKNERLCAVFIDIVRSTEKVVNFPREKVQKSLARFLDAVLLILLKYDLTIDKFHGDGVLPSRTLQCKESILLNALAWQRLKLKNPFGKIEVFI